MGTQTKGGGGPSYPSLTETATNTERVGAANNAAPAASTIILGESSRGGTDTNIAGAAGTIEPGIGTGTAVPAVLLFKGDNLLTTTGTSAHVPITRWTTPSTSANLKSLTNNTATLFARLTVNSAKTVGLIVRYHVEVNDGTNTQVETGMVSFQGLAITAGTITAGTPVKFGNAQTVSSGTLAVSFTAVVAGSFVDCKITSNTSLTATTHRVVFDAVNLSPESDVSLF